MNRSRFCPHAVYIVFALAGLLLQYSPTLLSGFKSLQSPAGDASLANYGLEHSYRWLARDPLHRDFRAPPLFYPAKNTEGVLDADFGSLPLYAPWRIVGLPYDTAFQIWMMGVALANFAAFALFLADGLACPPPAAALGAFLFAFALPHANLVSHPQLGAAFYAVLALWCLARFMRAEPPAAKFGCLFFVFWAAQYTCGFTLFWLFSFALAVALCWALALAPSRAALLRRAAKPGGALFVGAAIFIATAVVAIRHLGRAGAAEPLTNAGMPQAQSWFNAGPDSWLWGWLFAARPFARLGEEHRLGFGLLTLAFAVWGLRRHAGVLPRILLFTAATLMALATVFPVNLSLWQAVAAVVPGARAVPDATWIVFILLIPAACGLAWAVERLLPRWPRWAIALLVIAVAAEQGMILTINDKAERRAVIRQITQAAQKDCGALLITGDNSDHRDHSLRYQLDGMFAGLVLNKPTLNGPPARVPPGREAFASVMLRDDADRQRLIAAILAAAQRDGFDPAEICWLQYDEAAGR